MLRALPLAVKHDTVSMRFLYPVLSVLRLGSGVLLARVR